MESEEQPREDDASEDDAPDDDDAGGGAADGAAGSAACHRGVPEADVLLTNDPHECTGEHLPTKAARQLKKAALLAGWDKFAEKAGSHLQSFGLADVKGWDGGTDRAFAGPHGIGHVPSAGNCVLEAFAVGWHTWLIVSRRIGIAVHRDSIDVGDGPVDADCHFDPRVDPHGPDHPGVSFPHAVAHIRRKMVALVKTAGWWDDNANKDASQTRCGTDASLGDAPGVHRPVTLEHVVAALGKDRSWTGEFELTVMGRAFGCAIAVHGYGVVGDAKLNQRMDTVHGDPKGPLVQIIYHKGQGHHCALTGASNEGHVEAPAPGAQGPAGAAPSSATHGNFSPSLMVPVPGLGGTTRLIKVSKEKVVADHHKQVLAALVASVNADRQTRIGGGGHGKSKFPVARACAEAIHGATTTRQGCTAAVLFKTAALGGGTTISPTLGIWSLRTRSSSARSASSTST